MRVSHCQGQTGPRLPWLLQRARREQGHFHSTSDAAGVAGPATKTRLAGPRAADEGRAGGTSLHPPFLPVLTEDGLRPGPPHRERQPAPTGARQGRPLIRTQPELSREVSRRRGSGWRRCEGGARERGGRRGAVALPAGRWGELLLVTSVHLLHAVGAGGAVERSTGGSPWPRQERRAPRRSGGPLKVGAGAGLTVALCVGGERGFLWCVCLSVCPPASAVRHGRDLRDCCEAGARVRGQGSVSPGCAPPSVGCSLPVRALRSGRVPGTVLRQGGEGLIRAVVCTQRYWPTEVHESGCSSVILCVLQRNPEYNIHSVLLFITVTDVSPY